MRYYKLSIGDDVVFTQNVDNPTGPAIEFNMQYYTASQGINQEITLYNAPLFMFGEFQNYYDKKIELKAGFTQSPLTRLIGTSISTNDLLSSGYVAGIISDYNGIDTQVTFIVQAFPTTGTAFQFSVDKGVDPTDQISNAIKQITGNILKNNTTNVTASSPDYSAIKTVSEVDNIVRKWGLTIYQNAEGFFLDYSKPTNYRNRIEIKAGDFIIQPTAMTISSMAVTLNLRGDVRLLDLITLPKGVFIGVAALANPDGQRDWRSTSDSILRQGRKSLYLLYSGEFQITKIWHVGNSRNLDVQSWATHIEAVKYTGAS
jgi:hypothetical protein